MTRRTWPPGWPTTPEWDALGWALDELHEANRQTPCRGEHADLWTSESAPERARAADECRTRCPLLQVCHAAAESTDEPHHVWGAVDRAKRNRERKSA